MPATLIVGSARGAVYDTCPSGYDLYVYERPYDFFLIDVRGNTPDKVLDVMALSPENLGLGQDKRFDIVMFEYVPRTYSFMSKAIAGGLSVLKPGGFLVSTVFPTPFTGKNPKRFIEGQSFRRLNLGSKYAFFYMLKGDGSLQCSSNYAVLIDGT
ncbi:MAG: hypothetical protein LBJ03_00550 [Holosporales bacterium]|jgi:hypothetical protein|nr:hypothetical protein [Holosporales bacterium]